MKKTLSSPVYIFLFFSLFFASIIYFLDSSTIHIFTQLPFLAGPDGVGHWSIGEYYNTHIFPKTWGWVPVWAGGTPFPQFYPPFFYFFTALVAHVIPWVSYLFIVKVVILLSIFGVPAVCMWTAHRFFSTQDVVPQNCPHVILNPLQIYLPAILTGALSILVVCTVGGQSSLGFTMQSAINKGFVPQFFALIPILLCLGFTADIHKKKSARYGAGIFFCISLLTNVHTAFLLVILISCIALVQVFFSTSKKAAYTLCTRYLLVFGTAGVGASFWFVPLLSTYSYFSSVPLTFSWDRIDTSLMVIFLISFPCGIFLSVRRKNYLVLGTLLGISLIVILALCKVDQYFPSLPLHIYRWLAITPYISMLSIGYLFESINFSTIGKKIVFFFLISISVTGVYYKEITAHTESGIFYAFEHTHTRELVALLSKNPGLTIVGTEKNSSNGSNFVIDSLLGLEGVPTVSHVLRESAPNGLFLTPVRNTFSSVYEMAGVRTYIGKNENFMKQPIDKKVARAQALGVRYLVVSDEKIQKELSTDTAVTKLGSFGPRDVYEIKNTEPRITPLPYAPALVFTPLNFKVRPAEAYNFTVFNEQLFIQNKYPEVLLARNDNDEIDSIPEDELSQFSSLIFTEYPHKNLLLAFEKIKKFSETKTIHAVESSDQLYTLLQNESIHNKNIHTYKISSGKRDSIALTNQTLATIFKTIADEQAQKDKDEVARDILLQKNGGTDQKKPYYIRQTYYPWWNRASGEKLYAISPFYTLTFENQTPDNNESAEERIDKDLMFNADKSVYVGYGISILTLLGTLYLSLVPRRRGY
jgi:hypothetical protein